METKDNDDLIGRTKPSKHDRKQQKHVHISKDTKSSKNHRSTSNNRPGVNKEKYKQSDGSGPITAKNSKLPDAFIDVNYKGKRSMKSINKPDKKHHESMQYKISRNNDHNQVSKSLLSKSK